MPPDSKPEHWYVLGAGAIGSLFAQRLVAAGCGVSLLLRDSDAAQLTLTLDSGGNRLQRQFPVSLVHEPGPISRLLVSTKATHVDTAITSIHHRLQADTTLLILANGMGFANALPHGVTAFRGTTTEGAYRLHTDHTVHAGSGLTRVGMPGTAMQPPAWFTASWGQLAGCQWDHAIEITLWKKLAINCVINPLSAACRCRNGELASAAYRPLLSAVCAEVVSACRAAGQAQAALSLLEDVLQVIQATAQNRSSMLQDVLQRRRTEIDYINGFLLRQPLVADLDLPLNRRLIATIESGQPLRDKRP